MSHCDHPLGKRAHRDPDALALDVVVLFLDRVLGDPLEKVALAAVLHHQDRVLVQVGLVAARVVQLRPRQVDLLLARLRVELLPVEERAKVDDWATTRGVGFGVGFGFVDA